MPTQDRPAPSALESASARLRDWGLLAIAGDDAEEFLHGQFTNDLKSLPPERAQLSAYCAPKGGVIANFLIWRTGREFRLLLPDDQAEAVAQRLHMFRLRAAVDIDVCTGAHAFAAEFDAAPEAPLAVRTDADGTVLAWPGAAGRQLRIAADATGAADARADARWRLRDIEAGIPFVRAATRERFVAQYLNLDALGALDFDKGCYPGQEVVARLKYLGTLKHRTYRLRFPADTSLAPGDAVFPRGDARECGRIVDACADAQGVQALAVLRRQTARACELCAPAPDAPPAQRLPLPYPLPGEET